MCKIAKEIALKKKKIHDSLLLVIEQMLLVGFLKKTPKQNLEGLSVVESAVKPQGCFPDSRQGK